MIKMIRGAVIKNCGKYNGIHLINQISAAIKVMGPRREECEGTKVTSELSVPLLSSAIISKSFRGAVNNTAFAIFFFFVSNKQDLNKNFFGLFVF